MKKILFIDRDGTIIKEPEEDKQVDSLEKLEFLPGVLRWLPAIAEELDYKFVMVSNQDGLGSPAFPTDTFMPPHNKMLKALENEGVNFSEILIDKSLPEDNSPMRKPGTGMIEKYLQGPYNIKDSWVIGDRLTDIELASNAGCRSIYLGKDKQEKAGFNATSWKDIYNFLRSRPRLAEGRRQTSETDIFISLNLDGAGRDDIDTGLKFFDHMLQQIARHSGIDLSIKARGDLQVDEHHTIEDVALLLGSLFSEALGSKKGIGRYGFMLPMDDSLAHVALDLGGRPWLVWELDFKRDMIGDTPTEMFMHFFKSFSDTAKCNINIKAGGINDHHKIEAVFKGFARSLRMAISKDGSAILPSTKGQL